MKFISSFKNLLKLKDNFEITNTKFYRFKKNKWLSIKPLKYKFIKSYKNIEPFDNLTKEKQEEFLDNYLKAMYQKNIKALSTYSDYKITSIEKGKWLRVKSWYKSCLYEKKKFIFNFGNFLRLHYIKKLLRSKKDNLKNRLDLYKTLVLHNEFRLDIFLYKLKIFKSLHESHSFIQKGYVLINNVSIVNYNYCLKKGDIITFSPDLKIDLKKTFATLKNKKRHLSTIEIEPYLLTIIIIKDLNNLSFEDILTYNLTSLDLKKFLDYVGKN